MQERFLSESLREACSELFEAIWCSKESLRGKPSATLIAALVLFAKQCKASQLQYEQETGTAVRVGLKTPTSLMTKPSPINETTGALEGCGQLFEIIWRFKKSLRGKPSATLIAALVLFAKQCKVSQSRQEQEMATAVRKTPKLLVHDSCQSNYGSIHERDPPMQDLANHRQKRNAALLRELEAKFSVDFSEFDLSSLRSLNKIIMFPVLICSGTGLGLLLHLLFLYLFPDLMAGETILEVLLDFFVTVGAFSILCAPLLKFCESLDHS